ncbi:helix-turn-helix domain-containing protein [Coprococcus catus]
MKNNILQKLRIQSGKTQEQVAEYMNVSVGTVQNWEKASRFKSKDDLHYLLDLYDVDDLTRNTIVLNIYGKHTAISEEQMIKNVLECYPSLPHTIIDVKHEDFLIECLDLIESRMTCLTCAITYSHEYLNKNLSGLFSRKTAEIIDRIASEYGISVNALLAFETQRINDDLLHEYPLGDRFPMFIREYGRAMSCDEYIKARCKDLHDFPESSSATQIAKACKDMETDYAYLESVRYYLLCNLRENHLKSDFNEIKYVMNVAQQLLWASIRIVPCGKSHYLFLRTFEIKEVLSDTFSEIFYCDADVTPGFQVRFTSENGYSYLYCHSHFASKELIDSVIMTLASALGIHNRSLFCFENWRNICQNNDYLKEYITKHSTRSGE